LTSLKQKKYLKASFNTAQGSLTFEGVGPLNWANFGTTKERDFDEMTCKMIAKN